MSDVVSRERESAAARPAAVYERELPVSAERIWENLLDWEPLPYVHSQAFSSVRLLSRDRDGWRAEVGVAGGGMADVDVRLDRAHLRYSTRTLAGPGAGTDIVTQLFPRSELATAIRVDFLLPWAPAGAEAAIGNVYRELYVGLWDQDESMMVERQRVLDGPRTPDARAGTSVSLGRVRELAARLPLTVALGGRNFRIVAIDGQLFAHDAECPHLGGPLSLGRLEGCEAVCPWHGYRFDVRTGLSSDGRSLRLKSSATVEVSACDGEVRLRLP